MTRNRAFLSIGLLAAAVAAYSGFLALGHPARAQQSGDIVAADLALLRALEARLRALESSIELVADHRAILDNELKYTRGLDRHDETLIGDSFWHDAEASYGTLVSIDGLPAWANEGHAASAAHQHHVTTLTLDIDGDTAHEEGYILFSSDMPRDTAFDSSGAATPGRVPPESLATLGTGRYVNRYQRRDGEWRMRVHEYVHDISMRLKAVDLCAHGCRDVETHAGVSEGTFARIILRGLIGPVSWRALVHVPVSTYPPVRTGRPAGHFRLLR